MLHTKEKYIGLIVSGSFTKLSIDNGLLTKMNFHESTFMTQD